MENSIIPAGPYALCTGTKPLSKLSQRLSRYNAIDYPVASFPSLVKR